MSNQAEWNRSDERNEIRRDAREERRHQCLPKSRICEWCKRGPLLRSRQWVVHEDWVGCRACWHAKENLLGISKIRAKADRVFGDAEVRYKIDGDALAHAREQVGCGVRKFAQLAGWTRQYQYKLESESRTVKEDTAETILSVLRSIGVDTGDELQ